MPPLICALVQLPHQERVGRVRLLLAVQVAVLLGVPLAAVRAPAALLEQLLQQRVAAACRQTAVRVRLPLLLLPLLLLLLGLGDGVEFLLHARQLKGRQAPNAVDDTEKGAGYDRAVCCINGSGESACKGAATGACLHFPPVAFALVLSAVAAVMVCLRCLASLALDLPGRLQLQSTDAEKIVNDGRQMQWLGMKAQRRLTGCTACKPALAARQQSTFIKAAWPDAVHACIRMRSQCRLMAALRQHCGLPSPLV